MKDMKHDRRLPEASEAGQMPPTESNPVRQRYQMGCAGHSSEGQVSRQRTYSRQFNRGSGGGGGTRRY